MPKDDIDTDSGSELATRLRQNLAGEVLFDDFSRGRYSTDASMYQMRPLGVAVPKTEHDVETALQLADEAGVAVLARGGGTSQCGQTVNQALVIDLSKHLNQIIDIDVGAACATVQPGVVLDQLNQALRPHGLWFPVDVSTASRATIGGMAGNNSCGSRSIEYGTMRDNVLAINAWLADGSQAWFDELDADFDGANTPSTMAELCRDLIALGRREASEINRRFPKLMRRVGGYNIDALVPDHNNRVNLAHLLVGSEGTLALSRQLRLKLSPLPAHKVLGICHFPSFYQAMDATQHIVALGPQAVELVDRTIIELARDIPLFRATMQQALRGEPAALLLVEFAGEDRAQQLAKLQQLNELMAELGFPGGVVEAVEPAFQRAVWEVRKSGLNIVMSMKSAGKPVSFIEDCAVELRDLAEYTERLTAVFAKHGTTGTWYAHASVGTLHVRPVLNLKLDQDVKKMRAIAEEAFEMVRDYRGSHSGEHGDGIVRSEFHESMFGTRMVANFAEVKDRFDPGQRFNPHKIVRPPKMDDRSLLRFPPGYQIKPLAEALDWSAWGGFGGAVEMCNNNGACRKFDAGVMCPSYRVTRDEQHLTRGRANTLRLALSGQLGEQALTSPEMRATMSLCVGCKGCKRECPTGVDMAKMKLEFQHHYRQRHGLSLRDKLVGYLPYYAPWLAPLAPLANLRNTLPGLAKLLEPVTGFSAERQLPAWRRDRFRDSGPFGPADGKSVALLADTFNRYFEPDNLHAAVAVLVAAGYRVHIATAPQNQGRHQRPLCCGRTLLSVGLIEQARAEQRRCVDALRPFIEQQVPVLGLEPSCLLTLRDELPALLPDDEGARALADPSNGALLFEEFLAREADAGALRLTLKPIASRALLHGHCHQKAFAAMGAVERCLKLVPELEVETIASSCCGMAGAFGYQRETAQLSLQMAELALLPALRAADDATLLVADGTSCRHQIAFGVHREAHHVAQVLADALG